MAKYDLRALDTDAFFTSEFEQHAAVLEATRDAIGDSFAQMLEAWEKAITSGGKLLFCGNGGSAADAQHLAAELAVRLKADRAPIPALALTTDTSALTAIGNDMGFEQLFARQVDALARPGDLVIGISTSSNSPNVIKALKTAQTKGIAAAGFGGGDGGLMKEIADPMVIVPSRATARIQEMHILIGHTLCGALEKRLGLVD